MPDKSVQTIRDLIFYQYAKIIAKSAYQTGDNATAKKKYYGFIKNTFRKLQSGELSWSDILREDIQFAQAEKRCAYCGTTEKLTQEHIIPKSIHINDRCPQCDKIQAIHNMVFACKTCNRRKHTKGLYTFFHELYPAEKMSDIVPPLLEKKYLKLMYCCHQCAGTLEQGDLNGDGVLNVLDIDAILKRPCIHA